MASVFSGYAATDLGTGSMADGVQLVDQLRTALAERRKKRNPGALQSSPFQPLGNAAQDLYAPSPFRGR